MEVKTQIVKKVAIFRKHIKSSGVHNPRHLAAAEAALFRARDAFIETLGSNVKTYTKA